MIKTIGRYSLHHDELGSIYSYVLCLDGAEVKKFLTVEAARVWAADQHVH